MQPEAGADTCTETYCENTPAFYDVYAQKQKNTPYGDPNQALSSQC